MTASKWSEKDSNNKLAYVSAFVATFNTHKFTDSSFTVGSVYDNRTFEVDNNRRLEDQLAPSKTVGDTEAWRNGLDATRLLLGLPTDRITIQGIVTIAIDDFGQGTADATFSYFVNYMNSSAFVNSTYSVLLQNMKSATTDVNSPLYIGDTSIPSTIAMTYRTGTFSSGYDIVYLHTPRPSGVPTAMPSCGLGSFGTRSSCGKCPPGTYANIRGSTSCSACPQGYYTDTYGAEICKECSYPTTTSSKGSVTCDAYAVALDAGYLNTLLVGLVVLFLTCLMLANSGLRLKALVVMVLPTLNVLSDLYYLTTKLFFSYTLFICCLAMFLAPNIFFVRKLRKLKAIPHLYIPFPLFYFFDKLIFVGTDRGYPLVLGKHLSSSFERHDTIPKGLVFLIVWAMVASVQAMWIFVYLMWAVCINGPFIALWFSIGVFFYQTKVISITTIWNYWFSVYCYHSYYKKKIKIDTGIINEALFAEFLLQAIPQIVIQSMNNTATGQWDAVAVFSFVTSVFTASIGLYKLVYYVGIKRVKLRNVPLGIVTEHFLTDMILPPSRQRVRAKKILKVDTHILPPAIKARPEEIAFQLLLLICDEFVGSYLLTYRIRCPGDLLSLNGITALGLVKELSDDKELKEDFTKLMVMFKRRRRERVKELEQEKEAFRLLMKQMDVDLVNFMCRKRITDYKMLCHQPTDVLDEILEFIADLSIKRKLNKIFNTYPARRLDMKYVFLLIFFPLFLHVFF